MKSRFNKPAFVITLVLVLNAIFLTLSCKDKTESKDPIPIQELCFSTEGAFPKFIDLPPGGDNGAYDPTLAGDPTSGRVWMVFSRVNGLGGEGKISSHLAYSDDHGITWCYVNQINASSDVDINTLPEEYNNAVSAHWSHEVPSLAYDPGASPSERWVMTWHRYLHVTDNIVGDDDRQFANGWIAMKTASSPELLTNAPEIKLFSALGYYKDAATESYNNGVGGVPEIKLHELHPDLATAVLFTESGMNVFKNELFVSLLKGDLVKGNSIILLKREITGNWKYISTLLDSNAVNQFNSFATSTEITGFSATDLFTIDNSGYLLVTPVKGDVYEGLALYSLDFNTGTLLGIPIPLIYIAKTERSQIYQSGAGTYDELSYESGMLSGDVTFMIPQFEIYATGIIPQ